MFREVAAGCLAVGWWLAWRDQARRGIVLLFTAICLVSGCAAREIVLDKDVVPLTGTFTDFRLADGLRGVEIRIAVTHHPAFQAVVQFAEGREVTNLLLADVEVIGGQQIRVRLVNAGQYTGEFTGEISAETLVGTFAFASGEALAVKLTRSTSWWERPARQRP